MVEEDDRHDFPPLIEFSDKPTGAIGFDAQPCWSGSFGYAGFLKNLRLTAPMRRQCSRGPALGEALTACRTCPQRFRFVLSLLAKNLRFAAKLSDACTQMHESPFRQFDAALRAEINQGRRIIGTE
jgi:hypothetical protein